MLQAEEDCLSSFILQAMAGRMPANRSVLPPKKESFEENDWREGSDGIHDDQSSQDDRFGEFLRRSKMSFRQRSMFFL